MKNVKRDYYNKEIINCLIDGNIVSTKQLADRIGLSEKSVRNKIYDINEFLKEQQLGTVQKKPRVGIWLECDDAQRQKLQSFLINRNTVGIKDDEKQRVQEVLKILFKLRQWETITTQKLTEELYLSAPTVLKIIRDCELWLEPYQIRIINERNRGYRLECGENEYRVAFKNFIMEGLDVEKIRQYIDYFFYNIDTKLIQKSIIETENEWNYRFTDESFYEIFIYCCIAYQRKDIQRPIIKGNGEFEILQKYNEYPFAVAIFKRIQDKFHILFSNEDIQFLSIQIMCSKFMGISSVGEALEQVQKYDNKLIKLVDMMIQMVSNILDVDLTDDHKLRESLIFHLRPTIFRIRHGHPQNNSLISFIKKEYKNVFRATWSISILFEEYYGLQLTEDEVGYLVLYIQSALERKSNQYTFVLISDSSRGQAELMAERIRKMIPEVSSIEIMSSHDFYLYENEKADVIVSTMDLNVNRPNIITIPNLLSEKGVMNLRSQLDAMDFKPKQNGNSFSSLCVPLFDPELFYVNQEFQNKEELLKFMATAMEKRGYVTSHFYNSVMEREKATTTSIGNGISLPHGAQSEVIEAKVSIAILKNPILWNGDEVDIVFLLGVKMTTSDEIKKVQMFYKEYISLIEKEENIKRIKSFKSNIDLYKFLIQ